ncbi:UNVERIFIED_CONTAM: hypothetical protein RMT77_013592 [Armadillidium vulgare]
MKTKLFLLFLEIILLFKTAVSSLGDSVGGNSGIQTRVERAAESVGGNFISGNGIRGSFEPNVGSGISGGSGGNFINGNGGVGSGGISSFPGGGNFIIGKDGAGLPSTGLGFNSASGPSLGNFNFGEYDAGMSPFNSGSGPSKFVSFPSGAFNVPPGYTFQGGSAISIPTKSFSYSIKGIPLDKKDAVMKALSQVGPDGKPDMNLILQALGLPPGSDLPKGVEINVVKESGSPGTFHMPLSSESGPSKFVSFPSGSFNAPPGHTFQGSSAISIPTKSFSYSIKGIPLDKKDAVMKALSQVGPDGKPDMNLILQALGLPPGSDLPKGVEINVVKESGSPGTFQMPLSSESGPSKFVSFPSGSFNAPPGHTFQGSSAISIPTQSFSYSIKGIPLDKKDAVMKALSQVGPDGKPDMNLILQALGLPPGSDLPKGVEINVVEERGSPETFQIPLGPDGKPDINFIIKMLGLPPGSKLPKGFDPSSLQIQTGPPTPSMIIKMLGLPPGTKLPEGFDPQTFEIPTLPDGSPDMDKLDQIFGLSPGTPIPGILNLRFFRVIPGSTNFSINGPGTPSSPGSQQLPSTRPDINLIIRMLGLPQGSRLPKEFDKTNLQIPRRPDGEPDIPRIIAMLGLPPGSDLPKQFDFTVFKLLASPYNPYGPNQIQPSVPSPNIPNGPSSSIGPNGPLAPTNPTGPNGSANPNEQNQPRQPNDYNLIIRLLGLPPGSPIPPAFDNPNVKMPVSPDGKPDVPKIIQMLGLPEGSPLPKGFDLTVFQIINRPSDLTSPNGPSGSNEPQGPSGPKGTNEPQGPNGLPGSSQPQGPNGPSGPFDTIDSKRPYGPNGPIGLIQPQVPTGSYQPQEPHGPSQPEQPKDYNLIIRLLGLPPGSPIPPAFDKPNVQMPVRPDGEPNIPKILQMLGLTEGSPLPKGFDLTVFQIINRPSGPNGPSVSNEPQGPSGPKGPYGPSKPQGPSDHRPVEPSSYGPPGVNQPHGPTDTNKPQGPYWPNGPTLIGPNQPQEPYESNSPTGSNQPQGINEPNGPTASNQPQGPHEPNGHGPTVSYQPQGPYGPNSLTDSNQPQSPYGQNGPTSSWLPQRPNDYGPRGPNGHYNLNKLNHLLLPYNPDGLYDIFGPTGPNLPNEPRGSFGPTGSNLPNVPNGPNRPTGFNEPYAPDELTPPRDKNIIIRLLGLPPGSKLPAAFDKPNVQIPKQPNGEPDWGRIIQMLELPPNSPLPKGFNFAVFEFINNPTSPIPTIYPPGVSILPARPYSPNKPNGLNFPLVQTSFPGQYSSSRQNYPPSVQMPPSRQFGPLVPTSSGHSLGLQLPPRPPLDVLVPPFGPNGQRIPQGVQILTHGSSNFHELPSSTYPSGISPVESFSIPEFNDYEDYHHDDVIVVHHDTYPDGQSLRGSNAHSSFPGNNGPSRSTGFSGNSGGGFGVNFGSYGNSRQNTQNGNGFNSFTNSNGGSGNGFFGSSEFLTPSQRGFGVQWDNFGLQGGDAFGPYPQFHR